MGFLLSNLQKNMKKILNILFVKRVETENKWWHRLFTVLLFGSAIILFILTISLFISSFDNGSLVSHRPVAFSLEQNYQEVSGKELSCKENLDWDNRQANTPIGTIIQCDDVTISYSDAKRYGELYNLADEKLKIKYGIKDLNDKFTQMCKDEVSLQTFPTTYSGSGTLTPAVIAEIRCVNLKENADPIYNEYQNSLKSINLNIKVVSSINFEAIFLDIVYWIFVPIIIGLLWILFWSSIIYRSILYIIFGKKK